MTDSTLSTAIKGLAAKRFLLDSKPEGDLKKRPLRLLQDGQAALYNGLVAREDLLEEFEAHLPKAQKTAFFKVIGSINRSINAEVDEVRKARYIKSLSKQKTRGRVRAADWSSPIDSD